MATRDVLNKIVGSQLVQRADRFREGRYTLIVKKVEISQKLNGTFFIGEFLVRDAHRVRDGVEPNAIGTSVGFALNLDRNLSAPGNAKSFVLGLLGHSVEPSPEDLAAAIDAITSTAQPVRGMIVGAETYTTITRKGDTFVGLNWTHVAQSADDITKRRADLDTGKLAA